MTVMRLVTDDSNVAVTEDGTKKARQRLNEFIPGTRFYPDEIDDLDKKQVTYSGSYNLSTAQLKTLVERKVISIDAYIWFCLQMGNTKNESIMDVDLDDFIAEHQIYAGKNDDPVLDRNKVLSSLLVLDKKEAFQFQSIASVQLCLF